jgi:glucose/arabinose dehydrogenase
MGRAWRIVGFLTIVATCLLAACSPGPRPDPAGTYRPAEPTMNPTSFRRGPSGEWSGDDLVSVTTLVTKLAIPWGVTFLPDHSALVTERHTRRILKVGPGRRGGELSVKLVTTVPGVYANNEGGLLGIAASPRFAKDKTVFIYYTTKEDNRIAKIRLVGSMRPQPIVTGIPGAGVHDGGRLVFGPDGYLYATTGDASRAGGAQNIHDLGGKILRMSADGKPAPGNPFPDSLVWSYGHRNPEGIAWDDRGEMYAAEIGEAVWDEVNRILPGRNYGWPKVQGMGQLVGAMNPVATFRPEIGVTNGIAIAGDTAVVTCLRGQRIYLITLGGATDISSKRIVESGTGEARIQWRPDAGIGSRPIEALTGKYGRIRSAINAPDGSIWLTTSNRDGRRPNGPVASDDRILRLTFRRLPATSSTPTFASTPTPGSN